MVTEIRELCKKNGTSIKALERELGFGNGTISRWDKNVPAIGKVKAVANFFNVPLAYLTGEAQKEKPPGKGELSGLRKEAFNLITQMDDKTLSKFIKAAKAMLEE